MQSSADDWRPVLKAGEMWDEDASFGELSPDVQIQVLTFLPFRARVRFERVCKNWAALLDYIWKRQKRLAICFANHYDCDPCHEPSHRFALSDIVVDSSHSFVHYQRESFNIVQRCPNLIALYFSANQVATETFGVDLAIMCPKLEHISLRDVTSFIAFSTFAKQIRHKNVNNNNIRCIQIDCDDQDADDDFDEALIRFAMSCPKLESLTNFTSYNTISLLEAVAPKLVELRMGTVDDVAISYLMAGGQQLQRLAVKEPLDADCVQCILSLKHLIELELCATMTAVHLITSSNLKFKALSLLAAETDGFVAEDVRNLLARHGSSLQRLQVGGFKMMPNDFSMFSEHCHRLLSLRVLPSDPVTLTNASIHALSHLTNLKDLELGACIVTHNQIELLLNSLNKLKEISLVSVPMAQQIKNVLLAYARSHSRRQITAWFSYDDRPNASPPPRRRPDGKESRSVVRPPPGLSNIDVRGNLRIIYTH